MAPTEEEGSYFPLAVGSSWTYRLPDGSTETVRIEGTRNLGENTYFWLSEPEAASDFSLFRETDDGVGAHVGDVESLFAQQIAEGIEEEEGVDVEVRDVRPTPSDEWLFIKFPLEVGSKWDVGSMEISFTMTFGEFKVDSDMTIDLVAEAVKSETSSVPAGQFRAIKVDWTMHISTMMGGVQSPFEEDVSGGSSWFVRGVGEVRYEDEEGLVQLVSCEIK